MTRKKIVVISIKSTCCSGVYPFLRKQLYLQGHSQGGAKEAQAPPWFWDAPREMPKSEVFFP